MNDVHSSPTMQRHHIPSLVSSYLGVFRAQRWPLQAPLEPWHSCVDEAEFRHKIQRVMQVVLKPGSWVERQSLLRCREMLQAIS